jgi:flavin-dependent dehydrogenase
MQVVETEVAIVGARVGGSILGALLAGAGHDVVVVDRATFPSDTLSTHFFRGGGLVGSLKALGVLPEVLALGPPPLPRQYDYEGSSPEPVVGACQDPGDVGYALSVRRAPLDAILVARARRAGARVDEATIVTEVLVEGGRACGLRAEGPDGPAELRARLVVGADGRHSTVARSVDAPDQVREPAIRILQYRYVEGFAGPHGDPDGAEFSLVGDELVYVFPSDGGTTCVALSVSLEDAEAARRARVSPADRFAARIDDHPGIAPRYRASRPVGRFLGCGAEPNVVRVPWGPGWALVGDASIHQDPWTGLGMDNAGMHATFLAEAIDGWLAGRMTERAAMEGYHARRDDHALEGFRETVELGRDFRTAVWD